MRRWPLTFAPSFSAALCFATSGLFLLSYVCTARIGRLTTFYLPGGTAQQSLWQGAELTPGAIEVGARVTPYDYAYTGPFTLQPFVAARWVAAAGPAPAGRLTLWFPATNQPVEVLGQEHTVTVPLWLPAILAAILPVRRLLSRLRARNDPRTLCAACGYDLRATPERCPECGLVPTSVQGVA